MSWEKERTTPEMENEDRVGSTLRVNSEKSDFEVVIVLGSAWSRCQVSMRAGEFEWTSDWWDVSHHCQVGATVPLFRAGLERFRVLATLPYSRLENNWPPLELIGLLVHQIEHLLA